MKTSLISNLQFWFALSCYYLICGSYPINLVPRAFKFPGLGRPAPQPGKRPWEQGWYPITPNLLHCKLQNVFPKMSRNSSLVDISRNDFMEAEYCSLLGKENTSHGYCGRTKWPPPFSWARYIPRGSGLSKVVLMHPGKKVIFRIFNTSWVKYVSNKHVRK